MAQPIPIPVVQAITPKLRRVLRFQQLFGFFLCCIVAVQNYRLLMPSQRKDCHHISHDRRRELQAICKNIRTPAGPPKTCCARRTESDRFVPGTPPVLLRNAQIWTGARNGTEIVYGDVLLDRGLVVAVGYIPPSLLDAVSLSGRTEIRVEDLGGAWVTPGLVDLHSHLGVLSAPSLSGQSSSFSSWQSTSLSETNKWLFFKVHPTWILLRRLFSHGFEV